MNSIEIKGVIKFDPKDRTKKHKSQSSWKKVAIIEFKGEDDLYYQWFLNKRYNIELNRPLRGPHVTFINDKVNDITGDWEVLKKKYNGKEINVTFDLTPRTNSNDVSNGKKMHWWFKIPEEDRTEIHNIRKEIGLDRPYWGLHMSLGYANEKWENHSKYLHRIIIKNE